MEPTHDLIRIGVIRAPVQWGHEARTELRAMVVTDENRAHYEELRANMQSLFDEECARIRRIYEEIRDDATIAGYMPQLGCEYERPSPSDPAVIIKRLTARLPEYVFRVWAFLGDFSSHRAYEISGTATSTTSGPFTPANFAGQTVTMIGSSFSQVPARSLRMRREVTRIFEAGAEISDGYESP